MRGPSLRARVLLLLATVAAVLAVLAAVVSVEAAAADDSAGRLRNGLQPASDSAQSLAAAFVDQETGQRGYVLTADETFLDPYFEGRRRAAVELATLRSLLDDGSRAADLLEQIESTAARWHRVSVEPEIAVVRSGEPQRAEELLSQGRGRVLFDRLRARVGRLQNVLAEQRNVGEQQLASAISDLRQVLLAGLALLVLIGAVVVLLMRRWVVAPIGELRRGLRRIANGDLDAPLTPSGPPEVQRIARDADAMRQRIRTELIEARSAQAALEQRGTVVTGLREQLDASASPELPGLRAAGALYPAEGVLAGDWYDVLTIPVASGAPSRRVALLLADVSGHGAHAGLIAVRLKHVLTAGLRLGLAPHEALRFAADGFASDIAEDERFASCLIADIDLDSGRLRWANAGHHPALVVPSPAQRRGEGARWPELAPTGPLLSALGGDWEICERVLAPEEVLVAFTDGVIEARDTAGVEFGMEGVVRVLAGLPDAHPQQAVDDCVAAVRGHSTAWQRDDVTVVALSLDAD